MKNCAYIVSLTLVLFISIPAHGRNTPANQFSITLTGVVYDQNGAVIVTARVVAYGPDRKTYEATTNDEGIFELRLPVGIYKVEASAPHFCLNRIKRFEVVDSTYRKMSQDFLLMVDEGQCDVDSTIKRKQRRSDRKKLPEVI